jgi:hypothetical protein
MIEAEMKSKPTTDRARTAAKSVRLRQKVAGRGERGPVTVYLSKAPFKAFQAHCKAENYGPSTVLDEMIQAYNAIIKSER